MFVTQASRAVLPERPTTEDIRQVIPSTVQVRRDWLVPGNAEPLPADTAPPANWVSIPGLADIALIPHHPATDSWRAPDGRTIHLDPVEGIVRS
ncbi:hypothetical protein [Kitasatospora cathayae]|uniref:hypothetical protein n=1 Tax=Kitasatospora cathayae TaxID=3004092 RepID=UPI002FD876ED